MLIVQSPGVPAVAWAFIILERYALFITVEIEQIPGIPRCMIYYDDSVESELSVYVDKLLSPAVGL